MAGSSGRFVALLRGVNVGGKNRLPMKDLAAAFVAAGAQDVVTYIQSGNVVFGATAKKAPEIARAVQTAVRQARGFDAPMVVRSAAELAAVVAGNPFLHRGADERALHVMFLADAPTKGAIASLDPARSPGDDFVVVGRDVYLHLPNGAGRSKLTNAWFDARLRTTSTARNWATVQKLLALTSA